MPPSDCFRNEEEKEAFEALATPLDLLIRVHLAKASDNTDLWRRVFSIEAEEVTEFVSSQSRADLYRTLRTNSVINDTDFSDAVTLLRPGSPMGDHVLKALQSQSSKDSDGPSEAELHSLLMVLDELVDGPSPPSTLDIETVDLITERNPSVQRLSGQINTWLDGTEPMTFLSLWPFGPSLYQLHCEPLLEASTTAEWIRGTGTGDAIGLTEMESGWLRSMAESKRLEVRVTDRQSKLLVILLDETVIVGVHHYFTAFGTEAALRTTDPAMREWAQDVVDIYREQSDAFEFET